MNNFKIKTKIDFGQGALDRLEEVGNKKTFIVTDPFMVKSGMINKVTEKLKRADVTIFSANSSRSTNRANSSRDRRS